MPNYPGRGSVLELRLAVERLLAYVGHMTPDTSPPHRPWVELETIRRKDGYSRRGLAEVAGMNEETIRLYELGQRQPKESTVRKLADVLRVPYSVLEPGNPSANDERSYSTLVDQARGQDAA